MRRQDTLWGIKQSHAVLAARLMLEHCGVQHRVRYVLPGLHPVVVRAAGFAGSTVPALRLDGTPIVGTLAIARALDGRPGTTRRLYPGDPERRADVEAAEHWGHDELQTVARRLFQWAGATNNAVRAWLAREVMRAPGPAVVGQACRPVFSGFARFRSHATAERVRTDLAELPAKLAYANALVERGVIGGEPNAADFQILASLRLLLAFDDLRSLVESHRCGRTTLALIPHFPAPPPHDLAPIPPVLPQAWLP